MGTQGTDYSRFTVMGEPGVNKSFCSNKVQTAHYESVWSLVSRGLVWLIFRTLASIYFFTVSLLQLLTPWSPTGRFTTIAPYSCNKIYELFDLHWENKVQLLQDKKINKRRYKVVSKNGIITKRREDIRVGDLIFLDGHEKPEIPVDMVLLYSATRDVYLDLSSLTGEKDPVQKRVPAKLELPGPPNSPIYGVLYMTEPVADLDIYRGELCIGTEKYQCNGDNILLAGSILIKGHKVFGITCATGTDTKIKLKSRPKEKKLGYLERGINFITAWQLCCLFLFVLCGTTGFISTKQAESYDEGLEIFPIVVMYFLMFNGLVAQTLHFSLQFVRRLQAREMQADVNNLATIEQLGLTKCIVFDKTGTLTENKLVPKVLSVLGTEPKSFELHPIHPAVSHGDPEVIHSINPDEIIKNESLHRLLLSACVNNTVSKSAEGAGRYFGTSADEVALLESIYDTTAYYVESRTSTPQGEQLQLSTVLDQDNHWEIIKVFKYSSAKAMMSVLAANVRTNKVYLFAKGSPSKVISLLKESDKEQAQAQVDKLARQGFRIMLHAYTELDWDQIKDEFELASSSKDATVMDRFERLHHHHLKAIGVTATEDKLQPKLKETMTALHNAAIITLVCTGDIKLTAKNIAKNSGILPADDEGIFDVQNNDDLSLDEQLDMAKHHKGQKGILIGKDELPLILEDKRLSKKLFKLVKTCQGVVVYRATPHLKAKLTSFLKQHGLSTIAVGDGANDIEMIKEAHVGIGIKGGESSHAAANSDIAITTVSELPNLIFYHGKQNWERNSKLAHLISSMKLCVVLSLLMYETINGYTGTSLYTGRMLLAFNMFYGWATIAYALFHKSDFHKDVLPKVYQQRPGMEGIGFVRTMGWWGTAALDAVMALAISMWWFPQLEKSILFMGDMVRPMSFANFVVVMTWVNLRVFLETRHLYVHLTTVATLIAFAAFSIVPRWTYLPPTFGQFLVVATVFFVLYDRALRWITVKLGLITVYTAKLYKID